VGPTPHRRPAIAQNGAARFTERNQIVDCKADFRKKKIILVLYKVDTIRYSAHSQDQVPVCHSLEIVKMP
jgi:hypothetical protein